MNVKQSPQTVLLVEDEPLLRKILAEALEDSGFAVEQADSGDQAWSMVQGGLAFDIVLTDVRMPGRLNGIDLISQIRSSHGDVPFVVMSGYSEFAPDAQSASAFFRKPFRAAEVTRVLSQLVGQA